MVLLACSWLADSPLDFHRCLLHFQDNELAADIRAMALRSKLLLINLQDWWGVAQRELVEVGSFKALQEAAPVEHKLYYDSILDEPRGLVYRKVHDDASFDALRQEPSKPLTVFYFKKRQASDLDSPVGGPKKLQACSVASSNTRKDFRENLVLRNKMEGRPVTCLVCGAKETGRVSFAACHIVPFAMDKAFFLRNGITGTRTDVTNAVFLCDEDHQFGDGGYYGIRLRPEADDTKTHFKADLVITDGLADM